MTRTGAPGNAGYRAALSWSVLMVAGQQALAALVAFVLAAILGPSSFGTVAMASVYILFMQMLLQQAMPALIQRKDLDAEHLDSAFWLVMAATVVITGVSIALSGPWAAVNRTPDLQPIIVALSLLVPLQGLVVVQEAVLRRSMDFRSLAVRSLVAAAAGGVVGITMALRGAGTWALVGQQLATGVVGAVVLWSVSRWRPRLRFSRGHVHDLVGFSVGSSLASLAAFVNVRSDALLIGLFFGPFAVGLYRLASRFTEIFVDFLSRSMQQVAFPELSRLQADVPAFARRVRDIMAQSSLLALPALGVLAGCAEPILRLFGPEWSGASGALQILCLVAAVRALTLISSAGLQAIGRPLVLAKLAWLAAALSAGGLVATGIALRDASVADQVVGMAASRAVIYLAVIGPIFVVAIDRWCALPARRLLSAIDGPALAGIAAALAGALWSAAGVGGSWPSPLALAVSVGLTGSVALSLLAVINRPALVRAGRVIQGAVVTRSRAPDDYKPRHVQDALLGQVLSDPSGLDDYVPRHLATQPRPPAPTTSRPRADTALPYTGADHAPPRRARGFEPKVAIDSGGRTGGRPHRDHSGSHRPDVSRGASSVDLWTSLGLIVRRWKVTVPLLFLTLVASLVLGATVSPDYEASTTLLLVGPSGPNATAGAPPVTAPPGDQGTELPAPPGAAAPTETTAAPPVTEPDSNPLLTLNQSLISAARASLESINDDSVRKSLREAGLSTTYEVTVAQKDPIMQIKVTAPEANTAVDTLGALQAALVDTLQKRQDDAGAPANTRIQVQTLAGTSEPHAIYGSRRRAQLVIVALGLALTAIAAFGVEGLEQRRARVTASQRRTRDVYTPAANDGPPFRRGAVGDGEPATRAGSSRNGGSSGVAPRRSYGVPGPVARGRGSDQAPPARVDPPPPRRRD
jgi:O-antigen/teichoic acid export membrane protein